MKLVLDPGHGGHDPGAVENGLREKDLTLKIALYTRDYINELYEGVEVYLTREEDDFISLSERAEFANRLNADYFCSIHINAGKGKGFESFIYSGSYSKSKTQALRNVLHDTIISETGFVDRGRKEANLAVLRLTRMPAVLTENGFIDNPSDAALLKSDSNLRKIALAHAHGFARAFGWNPKKKVQTKEKTSNGKLYRVQVGAFSDRKNAERLAEELKKKGYPAIIV
ncbi:N-acetylmuramoyl-L-alanine amidase [Parageobacillus thermoglucosidasius]|uniref:N-acetylmuramoyl-L-alanine amidase n=1 Tax=Parageobacillus thermoglucosidasius TaxID=1426 RepID=UPI000E19351C|nr:N-acetylmuramoyl-L-alanine amidase [Parageobacillus thermoglucosidasius]MED4904133.1 N-acetylmuramoyl-L-alanine amidase [Parageobacillus thermoglucosidasius]MED4915683.1 N-acetylmuramoyl-L-alanine amidase [Parageobacillus thermoglucosidasius]MED4945052.1 N-acetylmuramoyl-L-alanine amidase [Parageobacillus thermoglucosidasius]MED4983751.1 N-acetylmuramoyl-L-alanine amidase [Parageobacillus thermoglucosidasius]RDE19310.1 N-acetylmuramoyl-L-alanine amidase [Parageobacillus thermoglucosidasius]